jgi:hypothetical protein
MLDLDLGKEEEKILEVQAESHLLWCNGIWNRAAGEGRVHCSCEVAAHTDVHRLALFQACRNSFVDLFMCVVQAAYDCLLPP